jgi:uncharacterized protein YbjT (DUF2867 family)
VRVLVTGATGFVGRAVLAQLSRAGHGTRILLRPAASSPQLPRGVPVEVALSSLADERGLRAALVGMDAIIHLAGGEGEGSRADLAQSDAGGTLQLAESAEAAGVRRMIFLSHLGADRASAYPVLRAKAEAEEAIRNSRVPHTIVRSAIVFGEDDHWTTSIAMTLALSPGLYFVPGDGRTSLQPLHVDDLAVAILWSLEEPALVGRTYEIGGPEYLTWREVVTLVMQRARVPRVLVGISPPLLRAWVRFGEIILPRPPFTPFLLDYLAASRTASLETLPRAFGLQPARMESRLGYLERGGWGRSWFRRQIVRGSPRRHA